MRFRDFLRVSVILFGGAATALAVVSVAGAARADPGDVSSRRLNDDDRARAASRDGAHPVG